MKNILLLTTILVGSFQLNATVWRVNNIASKLGDPICTNCALTVQDAFDQALPFDTIHIEGSPVNYSGADLLKPLTIIGPGYFLAENEGEQYNCHPAWIDQIYFREGSDGSTISGLFLEYNNSSSAEILFSNNVSDITISRCYITEIDFNSSHDHSNIQVLQCFIEKVSNFNADSGILDGFVMANNIIISNIEISTLANGAFFQNTCSSNFVSISCGMEVYNNIFTSSSLSFTDPSDCQSNNTIYNNIFAISPLEFAPLGSNSYDVNMALVLPTSGTTEEQNMTLETCSICDQGINNETIGAFGGPSPYLFGGFASNPRITDMEGTGLLFPGGTINLTISGKAGQQ